METMNKADNTRSTLGVTCFMRVTPPHPARARETPVRSSVGNSTNARVNVDVKGPSARDATRALNRHNCRSASLKSTFVSIRTRRSGGPCSAAHEHRSRRRRMTRALTFRTQRSDWPQVMSREHKCRIAPGGSTFLSIDGASGTRNAPRHRRHRMPEKETLRRARRDKRQGKAPSTQAGEFVREEMHHIREGKHGATSTKQAIAIGLSKARRAGVKLRPPRKGTTSAKTRKSAARAYKAGQRHPGKKTSAKRSRATLGALKREGHRAASHTALSRQARSARRHKRRS